MQQEVIVGNERFEKNMQPEVDVGNQTSKKNMQDVVVGNRTFEKKDVKIGASNDSGGSDRKIESKNVEADETQQDYSAYPGEYCWGS